jgi:hypothetical protein
MKVDLDSASLAQVFYSRRQKLKCACLLAIQDETFKRIELRIEKSGKP